MGIAEAIGAIIAAAGIPSAVFALLLKRFEKKQDEREQARREYEVHLVKMASATACLCEANAIALQNGKCNGETHAALDYLKKVKHDQRDFLLAQGIDNLF